MNIEELEEQLRYKLLSSRNAIMFLRDKYSVVYNENIAAMLLRNGNLSVAELVLCTEKFTCSSY